MGSDAALLTAKVVDNAFTLLTIETITLLQAVDFLKVYPKLSQSSQKLYTAIRRLFPKIVKDRVITERLHKVKDFIEYSLAKEDLSKA
jgi:histidine ammonia-lyase